MGRLQEWDDTMKVRVDIDIDCCDDCPFCVYNDLSDNCVLSDDKLYYPDAFDNIPGNCSLKNERRIKYSNVEVLMSNTLGVFKRIFKK